MEIFLNSKSQYPEEGLGEVVLVKQGCQEAPRFSMWGCESNQLEFPRVNILPRSNSFFGRTEIGNWACCTTFLKAILYYKEAHRHTLSLSHSTLLHKVLQYQPERIFHILEC